MINTNYAATATKKTIYPYPEAYGANIIKSNCFYTLYNVYSRIKGLTGWTFKIYNIPLLNKIKWQYYTIYNPAGAKVATKSTTYRNRTAFIALQMAVNEYEKKHILARWI